MKTNKAKKSAAKSAAKKTAKPAAKGGGKNATTGAAKATVKGSVKRAVKGAVKGAVKPKAIAIDVASEPIEEPPPSLMVPPIRRLRWGYALLTEFGDDKMNDLVVDAGTKVAIEGELDKLAYVYVVQVSEDRSVEVLYPPKGGSRRMRPGARMRIPAGTGWIVTTKKGKLRTIASTYPLTDEQVNALA